MTSHNLLCLASHSPRRRRLLEELGVPFFARPAPDSVEESIAGVGRGGEAELVAAGRARAKGEAILRDLLEVEGQVSPSVLAADTVVHLGARLFDKPSDSEQAFEFLRTLSGRRHGVVTALWLFHGDTVHEVWRRTWVDFDELSESLIASYVETGDPFDKAGGYGIQGPGATLIKGVEGCYYNVVGLPLRDLRVLLAQAGFPWEFGK